MKKPATGSEMDRLTGFHSVHEALESGRPLERVVVARGRHGDRIEEIVTLARERGVPVRFEDRAQVDRLAGTPQHQGVVALAAARQSISLEELLRLQKSGTSAEGKSRPGLIVLLDGIEDPHNLGAVVRSALAAGADGVVLPDRRASGLNATVARAAAGALEHLPVARVVNIARAMED
jgi:23S rRNA (guanosine2251-2'-O)-methyltransferase